MLQAVKDSDFLNAADAAVLGAQQSSDAAVPPVYTFERASGKSDWVLVDASQASSTPNELFVEQILVSPNTPFPANNQLASVASLDHHLRKALTSSGSTFEKDLCYHTPKGQCFSASVLTDPQQIGTIALFYGLKDKSPSWPPASALRWTDEAADVTFSPLEPAWSLRRSHQDNYDATKPSSSANAASNIRDSGLGITLPLSPKQGASVAADELATWHYHASRSTLRETAGLKWAFYALRAFVLRFWSLAKVRRSMAHTRLRITY